MSIRSSAAEYSTYVSAIGCSELSVEMRSEYENVWQTQKVMVELYEVSVPSIDQHIKNILEDGELTEDSVIQKYLIVAYDAELPENPTIRNIRIVQTEGSRQVVVDFCIFIL